MSIPKDIFAIFLATLLVTAFIFLCIYGWKLNKWFNWKMSYGHTVKEQVDKAMADHIIKYHSGEKR